MRQHDPMEIESQIAELLLGMPGRCNEEKTEAIFARFPLASDAQIRAGAELAASILEAAAAEYEAMEKRIADEVERRGGIIAK